MLEQAKLDQGVQKALDDALALLTRGTEASNQASSPDRRRRSSLLLKRGFDGVANNTIPNSPQAKALFRLSTQRGGSTGEGKDGGEGKISAAMEIVGNAVFASASLEEDDTHEGHHMEDDTTIPSPTRRSSYGLHQSGRNALSFLSNVFFKFWSSLI